jgi:hypothetical protein
VEGPVEVPPVSTSDGQSRYPYLKAALRKAAAAKTDTFLGERYRRLVRRIGKGKALVATGLRAARRTERGEYLLPLGSASERALTSASSGRGGRSGDLRP